MDFAVVCGPAQVMVDRLVMRSCQFFLVGFLLVCWFWLRYVYCQKDTIGSAYLSMPSFAMMPFFFAGRMPFVTPITLLCDSGCCGVAFLHPC